MELYERQFKTEMDLNGTPGQQRIYVLATTPRCGSHFVGHSLAQTGELGVPLEYLNGANIAKWHDHFGTDTLPALFENLLPKRSSENGWFGLKAHWDQFNPKKKADLFNSLPLPEKFVWIYRGDLLAQSVSMAMAQQSGQWISDMPKTVEPIYNYDQICNAATKIRKFNRAWRRYLKTQRKSDIKIVRYEDAIADPATQLADIARFIEPDIKTLPTLPKKVAKQRSTQNADWKKTFTKDMQSDHAWILEDQRWGL